MLKTIAVNAIVEYIENNLELMHINADALVEYSGYSKRYLQILFSLIIGIPVGKYIQMSPNYPGCCFIKIYESKHCRYF
ncbi:hypothetical protein ACV2BG_004772 [Escherichia coli]|uniref:HTH araC/xylS-type domain-containing protein n=2 Tax=Enterobacteriaceae TaxID=543 RepID=A0A8S7TVG4_ECOLX|nr:hypothetical protein [Salmonella enterica]ECS9819488.1 hypothetical protein [Salmonella enterica subsp. enterica serovar 4,[5],12:i:-]EEH9481906.1 hypothetical protein [Salmonella enterica subsp. enterica serovar Litchfield]EEV6143685.1 hypothetical protein [Escherichia coli]HAE8298995.1 hypothetical protein [Salmonella enterica subsp. enterica serovar Typhimurium]EAQ7915528.1 hypothetical protein [Salmonella enterica]